MTDVPPRARRPSRRPSRRRRRLTVLAAAVSVVLLAGGSGLLWVQRQVDPPGGGKEVVVEVPEGSSVQRIAAILDDRGVVNSARLFRVYLQSKGSGPFQAGSYRLRQSSAFTEVLAVLERGPETTSRRLTIPEGFTLGQVANRVGTLPGRSAERFLQLAASGQVRSRYQPPGSANLEGVLLPETYDVAEEEDEGSILERMVGAFDSAAAQLGLDQVTQGRLVDPYQAVTVASMVEREALVPEDRGLIARVIYNRLRQRIPLQVDATVIYALGRTGEKDLRLLNKDLLVDSPYNTYKVNGLPPAPIAAPGRASLQAAIEPPPGPWLYYVVVEANGKHAFAATFEEHSRNIALAKSRGLR